MCVQPAWLPVLTRVPSSVPPGTISKIRSPLHPHRIQQDSNFAFGRYPIRICDILPTNLTRGLVNPPRNNSEISTLVSSGFFLPHSSVFIIRYHITIWWNAFLSTRSPSPIQTMVDQKQLENVEYCKCCVAWRYTREIKFSTAIAKAAFSRKKNLFISKSDVYQEETHKVIIWSIIFYGAESWTLRTASRKYLGSFEVWWWRRMAKISWTDHVRNVEVLQRRVKEENNIVRKIKRRKANWIGDVLRRNRSLKHVIEGKMEGMWRRGKDVSSYWITAGKRE